MTTTLLAQDIDKVLGEMGMLDDAPAGTQFLVAPQSEIGPEHPMTGEKMARFLALHRASNFDEALTKAVAIQSFQGAGHSLGLHSADDERAHRLAMEAKTCASSSISPLFCHRWILQHGLPFH